MNVSSSTTAQLFQNTSTTSKNSNLSTEQKDLIDEVLADYDADSLSSSDATEIVETLAVAGIQESSELSTAMENAGFDAQEIGNLAQAAQSSGGRPAGGPPSRSPEEEEEEDSVSALLESLLSSEEEDDTTTTTSTTSSTSFDAVLDYTTKIMSLKDAAKNEVMDILEQYNSEDNELSKEDTQKFVVNSLSQILSESDNFNKISFYA